MIKTYFDWISEFSMHFALYYANAISVSLMLILNLSISIWDYIIHNNAVTTQSLVVAMYICWISLPQ